MRDFLGALFLIAALFAFGMFDFQKNDPLVEAGLQTEAMRQVSGTIHPVEVAVDGRNMTVTGLADSAEERDAILQRLRDIPGRGKVKSKLELLAPVTPFATTLIKDGDITASGAVPSEAVRATMSAALEAPLEALVLASGVPGPDWGEVLGQGATALALLESGRLEGEGGEVKLTGVALTPDVAARAQGLLSDLPEGYSAQIDLSLLDDGSPVRLSATKLPTGVMRLAGKLPEGLDMNGLERAGLDGADITRTPIGAPFAGWADALRSGLTALNALNSGHMALIGNNFTLSGESWSAAGSEAANAAVAELPDMVMTSVNIRQMDDGAPFELRLTFDGATAEASGKVPADLGLRVQAAFLDHPVRSVGVRIADVSAGPRWWQSATTAIEALKMLENGTLHLTDDRLSFTGLIFDPARQAEMEAFLSNGLPEGVDVALALDHVDDGQPFALRLAFDGQGVVATGKVPQSLPLEEVLQIEADQAGLRPGVLPAPEGWGVAVTAGADALMKMENGVLDIAPGGLRLTGLLRDPEVQEAVDAALKNAPEGYEISTEFELLDDGRPFWLTLVRDAAGARASGKVPVDLGLQSQSVIFGQEVTAGDLRYAEVPASPDWWNAARTGIKALALLHAGEVTVEPGAIRLSGVARDVAQVRAVERRLGLLPEGFTVMLDLAVAQD